MGGQSALLASWLSVRSALRRWRTLTPGPNDSTDEQPVAGARQRQAGGGGCARHGRRRILREGGYGDTRELMRRVTSTLEALSAYGSMSVTPSAGRLTGDLEPPGFETLAELLPRKDAIKLRPSASPPSVRPPGAKESTRGGEQKRLVAAAKSAALKAERELSVARKQSERAAARLKAAVIHAKRSEGRRAKLEKQLAEAAKEADAANQNARAADAEVRKRLWQRRVRSGNFSLRAVGWSSSRASKTRRSGGRRTDGSLW